jgi:hypothetical protein
MKALILLLVIAAMVGLLFWQFQTESVSLEHHQKKQQDLSVSKELATQQLCSDQAHDRFNLQGWQSQPTATFKGHFNAELGKCFALIENDSASLGTTWKNVTLTDAANGKNFASYSWRSEPGQKPADVPPFTCEVTVPSGERTDCTSETEFKNLIKTYLN